MGAGIKRKAGKEGSSLAKKGKARSASPVDNDDDEAFTGFGNGNGIYDDPMIDPTDSEGSEIEMSDDDENDEEPNEFELEEDLEQPEAGPSQPKNTKQGLYAPPTAEEIDRLQAAHDAGNTFTLQLEALLSSTLLKQTPSPQLKSLLAAIHDLVLSLPALPGVSPKQAVKRTGEIPFPGGVEWSPLKGEVQWTLGYEKPQEVFIGGSWPVCAGYKKGKGQAGGVDMVVVMPPAMFSAKDRMNYRYFHKRAHYLAVIHKALDKARKTSAAMKGVDLAWSFANGDERRPVIVMTAGKESGLKLATEIRIHAGLPAGVIGVPTMGPSKSLLRIAGAEDFATPLYSTSLLHDSLHKADLLHLHRLAQALPSRVADSFLALWRIWAGRRGIRRDRGGSGWFASLLLGWVVEGGEVGGQSGDRAKTKKVKGLGRGLGYWGIIRAAWEFLAHTDFNKNPVFLDAVESGQPIARTDLVKSFQYLLVDPSGTVNAFAEWDEGDLQLLQHHARETLALLEDSGRDHFAEIFIHDQTGMLKAFDEVVRVDLASNSYQSSAPQRAERPAALDLLSSSIAQVLRRGLSDRAKLVHVRPTSDDALDIGIVYNPGQATRVIDIGPSSDKAAECEAFERLWGDKAELRRFKDGSISQSVVWAITRPEEAALIPGKIVKWLLELHFGLAGSDLTTLSSSPGWSDAVQVPASARNAVCVAGAEKLGFKPIMDAYDELYRLLKSIDSELPLAILNVQPADEALRYSSTFIPHPIDASRWAGSPDCLRYMPKAEIVLQFESSPRWPDDLAAIQKVKLALLEKMARVIMDRMRGSQAGVVLDANAKEIQDHAALEVILPAGVAFHIRLSHDRERTLLQRIIDDDVPKTGTALPQPPRRLALPALQHHVERFVYRPQHHSAMAPMHHRFPSYSSATRLLKRWFAAHMLSLQVRSEAIELLMARVYLSPGSLQVPASATSGFVRALDMLAEWDWRAEPLFVPIFGSARDAASQSGRIQFPAETRQEAEAAFKSLRLRDKEFKHGPWIIVTEEDASGLRWTAGVSRVIAGRIRALAKAASEALRTQLLLGQIHVSALLKTPIKDYNAVIHLSPALITRQAEAAEAEPELWEAKMQYRNIADEGVYGSELRVAFNPAQALARDIKRVYGDSVLVFYDDHGGRVIGLLWNPAKEAPRALKPLLGHSSKPTDGEAELVTLNKDAILGEIARLGKGLIERVERSY